jgi:tetratricopeptide (TPR) repeat protein
VRAEFLEVLRLRKDEPWRVILPVEVQPVPVGDLWLLLADIRRIEYVPDQDELIRLTLEALGLTPNQRTVFYLDDLLRQGNALFDSWKNEEALPFFQVVAHLDPSYFDAWHNAGECYRRLGRHDRAIIALRRALEIKPENGWALIHLAGSLNAAGQSQKESDRKQKADALFGEAQGLFQRAAGRYPKNSWVWHDWGWAYYIRGEFPQAIEMYDQALRVDSSNSWAHYNRGKARLALEDKQGARQDFERAHELNKRIEIPKIA